MSTIPIAVAGAMGRMGQTILQLAHTRRKFSIQGALEKSGHPHLGKDVGTLLHLPSKLDVFLTDKPEYALKNAETLITFATPEATQGHVRACLKYGKRIVIGTTGLGESDMRVIRKAAKKISILQSPNMSVGVNLLLSLTRILSVSLGPDYDIEIVETHHRMKKDAPSGTALRIAEVAAHARGVESNRINVYGRHGMVGERKKGTIGVHAVRGGDVVGEHTVQFMGTGERLSLFHSASSRDAFASGALLAVEFLSTKKNGLWSMHDVLGLPGKY